MKWLLIGLALLIAWYFLAPLFTPSSIKEGPQRKWKRHRGTKFTVIEGEGRVVDDDHE